jgi:23S rRNA (adenine2503-C2)-methyltransferase
MTAPISPDVLTLPRKLPVSDKTNIVGLTRDALRAALIAAGSGSITGASAISR